MLDHDENEELRDEEVDAATAEQVGGGWVGEEVVREAQGLEADTRKGADASAGNVKRATRPPLGP